MEQGTYNVVANEFQPISGRIRFRCGDKCIEVMSDGDGIRVRGHNPNGSQLAVLPEYSNSIVVRFAESQ